jgi:hypothetical protein
MVMFMKDSGRMIKLMEKEFITIMMDQVIMENGLKMFNKVSEWKNGPTDHPIKGNFIFYERQHHNGLKHGTGKFLWPDLSQYEG